MEYTVVISPTTVRTRVLLCHGPDELLPASLPTPSRVLRHERAVIHFLDGLAQWLDARLRVVLSVGDREAGFCLGLTDEMGRGVGSVFYEVEVRPPRARRRRGRYIRGIGDFADLRQLRMSWPADGE